MAVMTTSPNDSESKGSKLMPKARNKPFDKTRPITATLDHPLILDIKLLKRLDMTTFTKKGLIALSKFCGISLINKTESKRKINKCLKTLQYAKKQSTGENATFLNVSGTDLNKRDRQRSKRKPTKQVPKGKSRIRFQIADEISGTEEDSSDVVCKRHDKESLKKREGSLKQTKDRIDIIEDVLNSVMVNIIPEPCKTCNRSEHPERFHSHPKTMLKLSSKGSDKSVEEIGLEEHFKKTLTTKDSEGGGGDASKGRKDFSAKNRGPESPQKPLNTHSSPETEGNKKIKSVKKSKNDAEYLKKKKDSEQAVLADETLKFVTGCYVCGRQISSKERMKHEEGCILEWRTQNSLLSPGERKVEPRRPDYRFTASGDLDPEGTFESIWANHKDSLVPCKKCGRKFFPDRIERHESVCNNLPLNIKLK